MLIPARRIPKRFSRPVSRETKLLIQRRRKYSRSRRLHDFLNRFRRKRIKTVKVWIKSSLKWLIAIFASLVILFFGLLSFSPLLKIREIRVTRANARLDIEEVQRILSPFFGRHLFFISPHEITKTLKDSIDDINKAAVKKNYPSRLNVLVELDPLYARLAILGPGEEASDLSQTGAIADFITGKGSYVTAPVLQAEENLPVIKLVDWGVRPVKGDKLISAEFLSEVESAEKSLSEQFGHTITDLTVFLRAQEYHIGIEKGIELWFDRVSSVDEQLKKYKTLLRNADISKVESYIDLRLSDRVVYK